MIVSPRYLHLCRKPTSPVWSEIKVERLQAVSRMKSNLHSGACMSVIFFLSVCWSEIGKIHEPSFPNMRDLSSFSCWKHMKVWNSLNILCAVMLVYTCVDRCMVPIPLRVALELNVLGAPGATSVTCCAPLGTWQDATSQLTSADKILQTQGHLHVGEAWHRSLTLQAPGSTTGDCHILIHSIQWRDITRQVCLKFMGFLFF